MTETVSKGPESTDTKQVISESRRTPVWLKRNIASQLEAMFSDQHNDLPRLLYKEVIRDKANQVFEAFLAQGILPGDFVNIYGENSDLFCLCHKDGHEMRLKVEVDISNEFISARKDVLLKDIQVENNARLIKKTEKASRMLAAMEYIFQKNHNDEIFSRLNEEDTLGVDIFSDVFGEKGSSLTIKEIHGLVRNELAELFILQNAPTLDNASLVKEIRGVYEQYMNYIFGIGNIYEGGAKLFEKSDAEMSYLIKIKLASFESPADILSYYEEVHSTIYKNTRQSTTVEKINRHFIEKVNTAAFEKMKQLKATDEELYLFARMSSGRGIEIDSDMRDSTIADKVFLYVAGKEGGMLSKLAHEKILKIKDKEVGVRSPSQVIGGLFESMKDQFQITPELQKEGIQNSDQLLEKILEAQNMSALLTTKKSYDDLTLKEQSCISLFARLDAKIRKKRIKRNRRNRITSNSIENGYINLRDFQQILGEVEKENLKDLTGLIADNFEAFQNGVFDLNGFTKEDLLGIKNSNGKTLFSETDGDFLELFNDIHRNGLFDVSDATWEGAKVAGILLATIAGSFLLTSLTLGGAAIVAGGLGVASTTAVAVTSNAVVQGTVMGAHASLISMVIDPRGHDSNTEMFVDIGTDIAMGAATGAIGGKVAQSWGDPGVKFSSSMKNNVIFAADISILGYGAELVRANHIDKVFHGESPVIKKSLQNPFLDNLESKVKRNF